MSRRSETLGIEYDRSRERSEGFLDEQVQPHGAAVFHDEVRLVHVSAFRREHHVGGAIDATLSDITREVPARTSAKLPTVAGAEHAVGIGTETKRAAGRWHERRG